MYLLKNPNSIMLRLLTLVFVLILSPVTLASSVINGLSVHSELGQESFIAGLFTSYPSTDAREILTSDTDKQIQVRVLAQRLSARRFKRMWIEGMAINASPSDLEKQSKNMAEFSNLLKVTLTQGDIFAIQRANGVVDILVNGSKLGTIEDPSFFDLLLRTWIGSVPLSSTFRSDLLVGGQLDQALLGRFNAITPSEERILAVADALKQREEAKTENTSTPKVAASVTPAIKQPVIVPKPVAPTIPQNTAPEVAEAAPQETQEPVQEESKPAPSEEDSQPEVASTANESPAPESPAPESPAPEAPAAQQSDSAAETEVASAESVLEEDDEEFTAESLLAQQLYISQLKRWVYKKLKYPTKSVEKSEEGTVRLMVSINRDRSLKEVTAIEAPKYTRLTKAALKAVEKSAPFPEFPATYQEEEFNFTLPIVFKLVSD